MLNFVMLLLNMFFLHNVIMNLSLYVKSLKFHVIFIGVTFHALSSILIIWF